MSVTLKNPSESAKLKIKVVGELNGRLKRSGIRRQSGDLSEDQYEAACQKYTAEMDRIDIWFKMNFKIEREGGKPQPFTPRHSF